MKTRKETRKVEVNNVVKLQCLDLTSAFTNWRFLIQSRVKQVAQTFKKHK